MKANFLLVLFAFFSLSLPAQVNELRSDIENGYGSAKTSDGKFQYTGQLQNHQPNGYGFLYEYDDGPGKPATWAYAGHFENSLRNGFGIDYDTPNAKVFFAGYYDQNLISHADSSWTLELNQTSKLSKKDLGKDKYYQVSASFNAAMGSRFVTVVAVPNDDSLDLELRSLDEVQKTNRLVARIPVKNHYCILDTFLAEPGLYVLTLASKTPVEKFHILSALRKNNPGCISGNCNNGYGVYLWSDSTLYQGQFVGGEMDKGVMSWPNRQRYEGHFVDGSRNGYGRSYDHSTLVYSGPWKNGYPAKDFLVNKDFDFTIEKDSAYVFYGRYDMDATAGDSVTITVTSAGAAPLKFRTYVCQNSPWNCSPYYDATDGEVTYTFHFQETGRYTIFIGDASEYLKPAKGTYHLTVAK